MDEITNQWLGVILNDSIHESDDGFNLIGYSFGGIAAFETAIKLQKQKKKIKNLILLDSSPLKEIHEQISDTYGKLFELSDKFSEQMKIIMNFLTTHIIVDYNVIKKQLIALKTKEEINEVKIYYVLKYHFCDRKFILNI
jgi:surfactin synthase thioesterase subunit